MATDPVPESPLVVTPDEGMTGSPVAVAVEPEPPPPAPAPAAARPDPAARRRADVDGKQRAVARAIADLGCEGAVLLNPAHVAWFTAGLNVRGLIADTERPGVYTNGKQRFLLCSNVDTQRFFDEELDGLGFQLKEWQWLNGRAGLLGELMAHKKIAVDRPYPNMAVISERLRPELRKLGAFDRERYLALGKQLAHALEATARSGQKGETEGEVAGHLAHRLVRRGAELVSVSVTTEARGRKYRRSGAYKTPVDGWCTIQATAHRDGLYVTASRTLSYGPPSDRLRDEFDAAARVAAVYWSLSRPQETVASACDAGRWLMANTPHEYDWRLCPAGYGAGWFPAEELRRVGNDDPFGPDQPLVWQARAGAAAVTDTVLVGRDGGTVVTGFETGWPFKRIKLKDQSFDVPDVLVR